MFSIAIKGEPESILAAMLAIQNGKLLFGWSGMSITSSNPNDLYIAPVQFRDHIMEGFVHYELSLSEIENGLKLNVIPAGSNRDEFIQPHILFQLRQAGLEVEVNQ